MNCCETCVYVCAKIASCFDAFVIYVPADYLEETISVIISNGQGNSVLQANSEVLAGRYVELDLSGFPDGFFSAYGGPYQIVFINPVTGEKLSFVAKDGNTYVCISFNCTDLTGGDGLVFVNAFSSEVPGSY